MQQIRGRDAARAILTDPTFVVPPVARATKGVAWLRATVGRFAAGPTHTRRRALSADIIEAIEEAPRPAHRNHGHPVAVLARAMSIAEPVVDLIRDVAQAYQPGTGDDARADAAVERLIDILGGTRDEHTAARIGVLVQACDATATLKDCLRDRPLDEVLRDDPPVRFTKRQATAATRIGTVDIAAGEVVLVELSGDLAFGAGPRRCPGADLAIALAAPESNARPGN
jgi:hypothetical protein